MANILIKVALIVILVRLLISTDKPLLCSVFYTIAIAAVDFLFQYSTKLLLVSVGASFVISFLYFWLLNKFHSGILYWLIFLLGIPLLMVF